VWFQSRSGFSVRRDETTVATATTLTNVSIPVWVFGPSRPTSPPTFCSPVTVRFNPGLGFRSVATFIDWVWYNSEVCVSIPVWVFGPSRRAAEFRPQIVAVFQSRSGFSVRRDAPPVLSWSIATGFNPGLGFRSVATRDTLHHERSKLFQSRSGFSVRRDKISVCCKPRSDRFQSRSGFSVRRDAPLLAGEVVGDVFQSRSGFSVRRDFETPVASGQASPVSIPVWVFGPSRRGGSGASIMPSSCFNPGLGFRSVATYGGANPTSTPRSVSIPVWVFGPSRRGRVS